jgi:Holin of 3TMs, for gene-transfer release
MAILETIIGPLASIIDKVIPDKAARDAAKLELIKLEGSRELELLQAQLSAIIAEAQSPDPWTSRARPSFLYVMYVMLLGAIPVSILAVFSKDSAAAIAESMTAYLSGLPDPLYTLFATGYLGYTAARQWGKIKGVDK